MGHPYAGKKVLFSTKHGKEAIVGPVLDRFLGTKTELAKGVDTDRFGTFSGEVERTTSPIKCAIEKARLGSLGTASHLGIGSEGSFGSHPFIPFSLIDTEILALVDRSLDIVIVEEVMSPKVNCAKIEVRTLEDTAEFLKRVEFGSQGLIVRPNSEIQSSSIHKGIQTIQELEKAITRSAKRSSDGLAHIETDMRAHMNPRRREVIREAAEKLVTRILQLCPDCHTPGWGKIDFILGLPCELCGEATPQLFKEIEGCLHCELKTIMPRPDGKQKAESRYCPDCNP